MFRRACVGRYLHLDNICRSGTVSASNCHSLKLSLLHTFPASHFLCLSLLSLTQKFEMVASNSVHIQVFLYGLHDVSPRAMQRVASALFTGCLVTLGTDTVNCLATPVLGATLIALMLRKRIPPLVHSPCLLVR